MNTELIDHAAGLAGLRAAGQMGVEDAEKALLSQPQVECAVIHRFGPGIYIREVRIPAGTLAIGHAQKYEHMNVMLSGRVTMVNGDGSTTELVAPMMFTGSPGRKVGYVHEDMVWLNIYATEETDVETLEATYLDKSQAFLDHKLIHEAERLSKTQCDRDDYRAALEDFGFTEEIARAQSEETDDMTGLPLGGWKIAVGASAIDGRGLFATAPIVAGEVIAPARIGGKRTIAGRFTNHAAKPNSEMVMRHNGDIDLVATHDIGGCAGGYLGDEITINYRKALSLSMQEKEMICQQ